MTLARLPAISIRQPNVHAILHWGKAIENRQRSDGAIPAICRHRGPLLLHASSGGKDDDEDWRDSLWWMLVRPGAPLAKEDPDIPLPMLRGGIVGRCVAVGHVEPSGRAVGCSVSKEALRWHEEGCYGLVLAEVEPLPFVPWKGQASLFYVPQRALAA